MKKIQDSYFHRAKREGYAARSVYKLEEIDRRRRLLRAGMRVLDLGCAPGSWLQYAAGRVGPNGVVVGVDLQRVTASLPAQARAIQADAFELDAAALREQGEQGAPFDVILSDMAPATTGIKQADANRSAQLAMRALELADGTGSGGATLPSGAMLRPGGALLVKIFQGGQLPEVRSAFRLRFEKVSLEKPKSSRAESVEIFLLGQGKRS